MTVPAYTSLLAQRSVRKSAPEQRERVFAFISGRAEGATDDEIAVALGLDGSSVRPRRGELEKQKRVRWSGRVRLTRTGRYARIWEAVR